MTAGMALLLVVVQIISATMANSENFRMRRIIVWLNPEEHAAEGAYQTLQGLYAIGSGRLLRQRSWGTAQKRIIPEVQNDMIFISYL